MNSTEIELLDFLSKCSIEFGILDGEGNISVQVNILNTDNTITQQEMKVRDIMYFTEYGTITIPGKFILEKSLLPINNILDQEISLLIDEIFKGDKSEDYIITYMNRVCIKIQDYVRNYMLTYIQRNNVLGQIIHSDTDENRYLYNLIDLSKYIRCTAKFEN